LYLLSALFNITFVDKPRWKEGGGGSERNPSNSRKKKMIAKDTNLTKKDHRTEARRIHAQRRRKKADPGDHGAVTDQRKKGKTLAREG